MVFCGMPIPVSAGITVGMPGCARYDVVDIILEKVSRARCCDR